MITKDNLVGMLEKALANEDEFVTSYGKDFLDTLVKTDILKVEEREEIKDLLTTMLEDTERHRKTINMLIEKIKGDNRNEF